MSGGKNTDVNMTQKRPMLMTVENHEKSRKLSSPPWQSVSTKVFAIASCIVINYYDISYRTTAKSTSALKITSNTGSRDSCSQWQNFTVVSPCEYQARVAQKYFSYACKYAPLL
jgi:hypothetical protein